MDTPFDHVLTTVDELRERYRQPSRLVQAKKVGSLDEATRAFIATSPFVLLATAAADGSCDVSPRGGPPGFVRVLDERRLALPDLSGNNLLDSLINVTSNAHVGLLFLLPGRDETLRVDGRAWVTVDPSLLGLWDGELAPPKTVVGVDVEHAFIHCAKSFRRGRVWDPASWAGLAAAPDACELLVSHLTLDVSAADVRANLEEGYAHDLAAEVAGGH
jgi:PPOX class probable FMN-dependent enzyme